MERDHADAFPIHNLPTGYHFRPYRDGDEYHWTALHRAAEPFVPITDDLFHRQYGQNLDALYDRMFFVETDGGQTVASISAWWETEYRPGEWGRIHWVIVHPSHQRRGLAKAMTTRAMQRLAQSYDRVMLGTSCARPWAIKLYLDFGFRPDMVELTAPEIIDGWTAVQKILGHPILDETLQAVSEPNRRTQYSVRR
jgi:GNAT superfamily N-acetyltransferase